MNNQKNSVVIEKVAEIASKKVVEKTVIETKKLSKRLSTSLNEELLILDNINLTISQGESVAITGASGSGKTTLLGLLAGLDIPSEGEASLLGKALSLLDEDERAELRLGKVGFVFQSFHLMDNLSALENVMLPLELDSDSKNIRQRALDALRQVGLEDRSTHLPTQLSGGEQQRVALARAFVSKPQILFADEPTGNLDRNTGEEIIALLFEMQQQSDTTLVMVTHDDSLAMRCQTHYKLVDGQIVS
ncbi:MAG: ATP-binding cassette domain-containing protein [Kangiellaceae bacterium]|nr:ATP-binding cassette domain-containing protein [Kangiellaceae bacterium]